MTPDERPPRVPPFYSDDAVTVHHGDCLDVLRTLPDCSVDSVVTDPPAGVSFMGREWDTDKGGRDAWVAWLAAVLAECRRILRPGGHALVWALPRTSGWTHRAIEDAGLDVRDCITHLFGSGFPKSLDVGKAIDRQRKDNADWQRIGAWLRARRMEAGVSAKELCDVIGAHGAVNHGGAVANWESGLSCPTWDQWVAMRVALGFGDEMDAEVWLLNARKGTPGEAWERREVIAERRAVDRRSDGTIIGLGHAGAADVTAPATEDAARWDGWGTALKPSSEMWYLARKPLAGTVAANVLTHGTGALNIAATRVAGRVPVVPQSQFAGSNNNIRTGGRSGDLSTAHMAGRWPSNVVLTHSPSDPEDGCEPSCPVAELDAQSGNLPTQKTRSTPDQHYGEDHVFAFGNQRHGPTYFGDQGGASRFFPVFRYQAKAPTRERPKVDGVAHPTVKPVALMRWLCRLVTPPGGVVLDPFGGSGSTAEAAILEGFRCITIEREAEYLPLILERIRRQQPAEEPRPATQQMSLLDEGAA